jgi:PAS domain S-box-containing protein
MESKKFISSSSKKSSHTSIPHPTQTTPKSSVSSRGASSRGASSKGATHENDSEAQNVGPKAVSTSHNDSAVSLTKFGQVLTEQNEVFIRTIFSACDVISGANSLLSSIDSALAYTSFISEGCLESTQEGDTRTFTSTTSTIGKVQEAFGVSTMKNLEDLDELFDSWRDENIDELYGNGTGLGRNQNHQDRIVTLKARLRSFPWESFQRAIYFGKNYLNFLNSRHYKEWRALDRALTLERLISAGSPGAHAQLCSPFPAPAPIIWKDISSATCDFSTQRTDDPLPWTTSPLPAIDVFADLCREDYLRMTHASTWIVDFMAAVENLPHAVSITRVPTNTADFDHPLIYVNKFYCGTTGYSRRECIGRDPRFLQCSATSTMKRNRLAEALKSHKRSRLTLTNRRKDGSTFENNMVMKFIRDQYERPCYVICLSVNLSNVDARDEAIAANAALMSLIPGHVVFTDEMDPAANAP